MNEIDIEIEKLKEIVITSKEYRTYQEKLHLVKQREGLKEKIDDFRIRNFELQNSEDVAFDKVEKFEEEYAKFREEQLVSDFLAAELALCRMMQDINTKLFDALNFE